MHPTELEIRNITDSIKFASYFDFNLEIGNNGRLGTKYLMKKEVSSVFQFYVSTSY